MLEQVKRARAGAYHGGLGLQQELQFQEVKPHRTVISQRQHDACSDAHHYEIPAVQVCPRCSQSPRWSLLERPMTLSKNTQRDYQMHIRRVARTSSSSPVARQRLSARQGWNMLSES